MFINKKLVSFLCKKKENTVWSLHCFSCIQFYRFIVLVVYVPNYFRNEIIHILSFIIVIAWSPPITLIGRSLGTLNLYSIRNAIPLFCSTTSVTLLSGTSSTETLNWFLWFCQVCCRKSPLTLTWFGCYLQESSSSSPFLS